MVSGIEPKLKRSLSNLLHIWLLLCGAVVLVFFLYFNRLSTHTSLQYTDHTYRLYDRYCVEIIGFRQPQTNASFYYPLWLYGQKLLNRLHQRSVASCHHQSPQKKTQKTPSSPDMGEPGSLR